MIKLFQTPYDSTIIYVLLTVYALTSAITVFDTRLIQARRNGTIPKDEPMLPSWIGLIAWLHWIVLLALFLLNWKIALVAMVVKFILSVLPVLEVVGNLLMAPFKTRSQK